MKCPTCPRAAGLGCAGERLTHLCFRPDYRDWLAARDPGRSPGDGGQVPVIRAVPRPTLDPGPRRPLSPDGRARVGLLCPCLAGGGAEAMQIALARYTDPAKIAWLGCCVVADPGLIDPGMLGLTSALMPVTTGREAARSLAAQCDLLVTWAIDGLPEILTGLPDPPEVVSIIHAPADSPWGRSVYARTGGIDRWVAVSELALAALPEDSRVRPSSVIWNAVDAARMAVTRDRATMRRAWGVPEGALVAGYLGRLSAEKDPHAMIRLASALPSPWHAVLVGSGAERFEEPGPPNVHRVGNDSAAGDVLGAFDVLVVPSEYESFGLTMAEGIVAGVPVVSTSSGIARLAPGSTRLIPVGADGPTIARVVLQAHQAGPSAAARALIPRLEPERFGREWTELLTGLVPPPPPPPAPSIDPKVRDAVNACPDRGGVLSISLQREGCGCGELSECRAGKGRIAGRVGLRDCLACQAGAGG